MLQCPSCGASVQPDAIVCPACGAKIKENESGPVFSPIPPNNTAFLSRGSFWGSLVLIAGFFINWLNIGLLGSIAGYQILIESGDIVDKGEDSIPTIFIVLLWTILVSGILCLLYSVRAGLPRGVYLVTRFLPILSIIALIIIFIVKSDAQLSDFDSRFFEVIGVGVYMVIAGAILLLASGRKK
jgi:hypothetical protein